VQVDRVNAVRRRLREAKAYLEQCRKALEGVEDPSDQYVSIVLKLSEVMDGLETGYKALAGDADVKRAIDRLNETARPKVKLGPSQAFTQELPEIRKLRETVNAGVVRFEYVGGVPEVPVTLNGGVDVPMVVDSGAAIVTLTSETAKRLGLKPSPGDRVLQLRSADGKLTEAHIMKLKTVRLGKFTVEDVECAVQPPDVKGADNLLGGTFLRHFVYKMDLSAGVLRLTQLTPEGRTAVATTQGAGMVPPPAKPPEVSPVRPPFEIVSARFGGGKKWADVTDRIKELLATGQEIKANTKTLGADPTPGYKKHLEITYMQGGEQKTMRVAEGSEVAASDLKR
jgi:clan AA aspartic protease (TIGR02281 family)